jgi:hypothetical protein
VEEVFAAARNAESAAEELLVDDGWKPVEIEPETIAVNGNGHHDAIGSTVELVPANGHRANGNGHAPVQVNGHDGNGHHSLPRTGYGDEAEEPQQSLFSWAEFMAEEPVKPKRRNGKLQPASMSMFEWAMELEREKETIGAGR